MRISDWSSDVCSSDLNPGDFKSTFVGDTPVVVTRTPEGDFAAWVNRCAHRGAIVCREKRGNARSHACIYHQWSYNSRGDLEGVPFRSEEHTSELQSLMRISFDVFRLKHKHNKKSSTQNR